MESRRGPRGWLRGSGKGNELGERTMSLHMMRVTMKDHVEFNDFLASFTQSKDLVGMQ